MTTHTLPWKQKQRSELEALIQEYPVVLVADIKGFPASLFQLIRKKLSGDAVIRVAKTRVLRKVLEESGDKKVLIDYASGSCAVIFTRKNPFELFAYLKKNKGSTFAKEGMITESDIVIPAGDTGLPPGPALSDLKAAGLPVKMQGPTIQITEDKTVTRKGEAISKNVANVLSKLDIKPIKIGLEISAAYEEGVVYRKDVLDIDIDAVAMQVTLASSAAFDLAMELGYLSPQTVEPLIAKAFRASKALAMEGNFLTAYTTEDLVGKAVRSATALSEKVPEGADSESAPEEEKNKTPEGSEGEKKEAVTKEKKESPPKEEGNKELAAEEKTAPEKEKPTEEK